MIALHQVRAVTLTGFVEVASFVGIDPFALLRQANISPGDIHDAEFRLPASAVSQLLEDSASLSGCQSFGLLMAECRTFESLGPIALLLQHLGSAREVFEKTGEYRRQLNDIVNVSMTDVGETTLVEVGVLPQFVGPQVSDLTVAMTQHVGSGASRGQWKPIAVHFRHEAPDDLKIFKRFFSAPVQFGSTFDGFECDTKELDRRWPWESKAMAQNAVRLLQQTEAEESERAVSDQVFRSIALLLPTGRASLEQVAAAVGGSPRALQRMLDKEDTTFGDLLNEARRQLATRYLSNPVQAISSVAEWTGYSSNSSFTRWFVGEFGVSPSEWRETSIVSAA